MTKYLTVAEVAELLGIPPNKVLVWIGNGELTAIDVSNSRHERPRWRIGLDDLGSCLEKRRSVPTVVVPQKKPKRSRRMDGIPRAIK